MLKLHAWSRQGRYDPKHPNAYAVQVLCNLSRNTRACLASTDHISNINCHPIKHKTMKNLTFTSFAPCKAGQPLYYQDRLDGFMPPCLNPAMFLTMKKVLIFEYCSVISASQLGLTATAAVHVVTVTSWLYIFSWALLSQSKPRQRAWERCQTSAIPHIILSLSLTPTLPEVPWRTEHGYNSGTVTQSYVSNIHLIPISCRKLL